LTYPEGNTPRQVNERDQERRARAQARKPLIAKWDPGIPTGYIHVDDAIEYMHRRWGKMLRAEILENFSRDEAGPKYTIFGDWPDKSRGERYYMFEDIDLWVYRTMAGVPAGWRDIRRLPKGQRSTVPVRTIEDELFQKLSGRVRGGKSIEHEESSDGRTRIKEDGRRRN
jgi:hypothetical protein